MNNFAKRLLSVITALFMLVTPASTLASDEAQPFTLCELSSFQIIENAGLTASSLYTQSGDFTMRLAGEDLYRSIEIPVKKSDLSAHNYIEFWVYSANSVKSTIALALISDNPETECTDHYVASFGIKSQGWNLISLPIGESSTTFVANHSPLGWDSIDELRFWPYYGGKIPAEGAELYFDDVVAVVKSVSGGETSDDEDDTPAGSETGYGKGADDFMLYDMSTAETCAAATNYPFSEKYALSGDGSAYWGGESVTKMFQFKNMPLRDWTDYKYLQMTLYSELPLGEQFSIFAGSENPNTDGVDGFSKKLAVSAKGWQTFTFELSSQNSTYRTPLGWDQIDKLQLWSYLSTANEIYIDRIWLTNSPIEDIADYSVDNSVDYLIEAAEDDYLYDVKAHMVQNRTYGVHPRLIMTETDFDNLKTYVQNVPFIKSAYSSVKTLADSLIDTPVYPYKKSDGLRLDRNPVQYLVPLALTYKITGETKYLERLWLELENVCTYRDWNPTHDIDVGDFGRPVALVFDWCYDDFTPEQRRVIRNGMVRCGIHVMINHMRNGSGFTTSTNNHNTVTGSGLGMIALAIADEEAYSSIANEVINRLRDIMPKNLDIFAPEGICPEGPSYWAYGNDAFFQYQSACFSALGTDFGFSDMSGLDKTGAWLIDTNSASDLSFNFGDASRKPVISSSLMWLADLYNQPSLASYRMSKTDIESAGWLDMIFYRDGIEKSEDNAGFALDAIYNGEQSTGSIRSTWDNSYGNSILFKGGGGGATSHADLDAGTFVLDSMGERWIEDLGSDTYILPGMFSGNSDTSGRWRWYRKRAEGHNTLVVNPKYDSVRYSDQNANARCRITDLLSFETGAYATVDLTDAYNTAEIVTGTGTVTYETPVEEVVRGYALINNRSTFIIQDEIKNNEPAEFYSFYHTMADVDVSDDGKSAVMTLNGKKMRVTLASPSDAKLTLMAPKTMIKEYEETELQNQNVGYTKLAVHLKNAINPTISVVFQPLYESFPEPDLPSFMPIVSWRAYNTATISLASIEADGIPVEYFNGTTLDYSLETNSLCTLSAVAKEGQDVQIVQPTEDNPTGYVYVSDGEKSSTYTVSFTSPERVYKPKVNPVGYEILSADSDHIPQADQGHIPSNTFDGDTATRYSGDNDVKVWWDLGEVKPLDSVMIAFMNGDQRATIFELEISDDGNSWTQVFAGQSSGTTSGLETFPTGKVNARYVRFVGHGNTTNEWNSISEVLIPEPTSVDFYDIAGHWAYDNIYYMANEGFINGTGDDMFSPESNLTKAQAMALAVRILGMEVSDAEGSEWYKPYFDAASKTGFVPTGWYYGGSIDFEAYITREEMCMLIASVYKYATGTQEIKEYGASSKFEDISAAGESGRSAIEQCLTIRMVNGIDGTHFAPKANLTRAEAAVLLERLYLAVM